MGGVVKAVSNVVSSVVNGVTTGNFTPSGGGGKKSFWDDPFGNAIRWVGDTAKAVIENPLPVIETFGLTLMGVPPPLASSMVTAMNGGDMGQIITAGVTSYIGQEAGKGIGNFAGDVLGASTTTAAIVASASGASVGATLNGLANGKSFSDSLASGLTAGAFAGVTKSINLGMNAAATELNTPTPNADNLNIPPLTPSDSPLGANEFAPTLLPSGGESLSPVAPATNGYSLTPVQSSLSPIDATAPSDLVTTQPIASGSIESSPLPALTSEPSQTTQPLTLPPEINSFPDTTVDPNYSLSSTLTKKPGVDQTTGTGMTASPLTTGATDVGTTPVDYGLVDPNSLTGSPVLGLPTSPAIKTMGGGQGLTADVTNPVTDQTAVVGGLGTTPTGAAPVLGDPSSFINNPNVTGQPVMAVDPAYYDVTLPKVSLSKSITSGLASLPIGAFAKSSGSTGSNLSSPLSASQVAESYLTTHMVNGQPLTLPQLKQLYPEVVPELSKLLIERGMNLNQSTQPINFLGDTQNQPSQNSADLNAVSLANFGQPTEDYQYAAKGGSMRLPKGHKPEFITGQTGHYAQGRGTGQSDDIPAVLHDGDYVVDADTVAAFGDGSSKAGAGALEQFRRSLPEHHSGGGQPIPAQIADGEYVLPAGFVTSLGQGSNKQGAKMLDAMREQIRAHKRSAPDTKIPPKAKSPLQYMREAMKG